MADRDRSSRDASARPIPADSAAPQRRTAGGIVQVVLGGFLIGLMGFIALRMAPMLLIAPEATADGSRFNGSRGAALLVLALFGSVMLFGGVTVAQGLSLIRTGAKPRKLLYLQWAAAAVILVLIALVVLSLKSA